MTVFDQLLENAAHCWLAERDRPDHAPCTIWRSIVERTALEWAKQINSSLPPLAVTARPKKKRAAKRSAPDFKSAAANDFTPSSEDDFEPPFANTLYD